VRRILRSVITVYVPLFSLFFYTKPVWALEARRSPRLGVSERARAGGRRSTPDNLRAGALGLGNRCFFFFTESNWASKGGPVLALRADRLCEPARPKWIERSILAPEARRAPRSGDQGSLGERGWATARDARGQTVSVPGRSGRACSFFF
jgi:hypothetical protein